MSVLPVLVGLYIASIFIHFPFEANTENVLTISLVTFVSLSLALLGYLITKQIVAPIADVAAAVRDIAIGKPIDQKLEIKGSDELEELSQSLQTISSNAHELLGRVEKLSQKDKLTGLYNAAYIRERLQEEIQRAMHFQRPCSFAYIVVPDMELLPGGAEALKNAAEMLRRSLGVFDRAARTRRNEFAVILPDKNKKQAIELLERLRGHLTAWVSNLSPELRGKVAIGFSENPLDGTTGQELYLKAQERAKVSMATPGETIEGFV
jgi:diguanylate cyclase (GGDEF)-like protein